MRHPNRNGRCNQRREEAAQRQREYDALSLGSKAARAFERAGAAWGFDMTNRDERAAAAIRMDRQPTREFARLVKQLEAE